MGPHSNHNHNHNHNHNNNIHNNGFSYFGQSNIIDQAAIEEESRVENQGLHQLTQSKRQNNDSSLNLTTTYQNGNNNLNYNNQNNGSPIFGQTKMNSNNQFNLQN